MLVHKVGHEIGNPLTSIISLGTIIERFSEAKGAEGIEPEKIAAYAKSIIKEAWRISGINEKLVLLLSQRHPSPAPCNVAAAIERSINKLKSRGIVDPSLVRLVVNGAVSPEAYIDQDQFLIILNELISNAATAIAAEEGGAKVSVQAACEDGCAQVIVENPLAGPIVFELSALFEPFVTSYENQKRLGIGLSTVAVLVERFNGKVELREVSREGRLFFQAIVNLPVPPRQEEVLTAAVAANEHGGSEQKRLVLIVEDEPTVASAMGKILTSAFPGGVAVKYLNGTEAIKEISEGKTFAAIICDLQLQNTSGRHVFETLVSKRPGEADRFAFLTAEQLRPETRLYLKTTKRPFLLKPFEPEELIILVKRILEPD